MISSANTPTVAANGLSGTRTKGWWLFHLGISALVDRPVCTILGGANGSGKSSIYAALSLVGRFVNADVVARHLDALHPERVSVTAGRLVLRELDQLLATGESFVYETTLSSHQSIGLMRRARDGGYEVDLAYVSLRDADLHVERVASRVAAGGHGIPEGTIRRRYETSLERLRDAIRLADRTSIVDNSSLAGPSLLMQITDGAITLNTLIPMDLLHTRIASRVGEALGLGVADVFAAAQPGAS
jgi:predicted ABC-type ATPase